MAVDEGDVNGEDGNAERQHPDADDGQEPEEAAEAEEHAEAEAEEAVPGQLDRPPEQREPALVRMKLEGLENRIKKGKSPAPEKQNTRGRRNRSR